jgi:high affinity Mn2+ porin
VSVARIVATAFAARVVLAAAAAHAQAAPPAEHEDSAWDVMNVLSDHGLHDLNDESWNVYGQTTYISSWKLPFSAAYTNENGSINSLSPDYERSFTWSFTLFFGLKLWKGAEAYLVPEVISERAFSNLRGIGGAIQNFELQKTGSETPQLYRARTYVRQTIDLGGDSTVRVSNPMQLGGPVDSHRLVFTAGTFTVLDLFDRNNVTGDPRQTFFNMAFMTHASYDFAADARGYSYGGAAELYWDDWAARISRMAPPLNPNVLPVVTDIMQYHSDSLELEHDHKLFGLAGAVRILGYRNYEVTGKFADAIAAYKANPLDNAGDCPSDVYSYDSGNFTAPDLCWVRKPNQKLGIGINAEQYVAKDIGVFVRAMYSDGQSEVDAFDPADRDLSFGAVAKGTLWNRHFDVAGVGFAASWVSAVHAQYLAMGGVDGFVGDGALRVGPETVLDTFYSYNLLKAIWLAGDYQFLSNPGFNRDRGPVHIFGAKVHAEF